MEYRPTKLPANLSDEAQALASYLEDELQRISSSLIENIIALDLSPAHAIPLRPRTGMIVYADGTDWNPGSGAGLYVYSGSAWLPFVSSIATLGGAFTLNSASGITNLLNDIKLFQATTSQFGAVKVDGATILATAGVLSTNASPLRNSLGADVALNNIANFFDGPSVAQGTVGTWFASGSVTVADTAGAARISAKLWDGTTVIASGNTNTTGATGNSTIALSGWLASPAANIRISCQDLTSASGKIVFNFSGTSKDSTLSAFRIA